MKDDLAFLASAPNEPIARMWEQILLDEGVPVLVRAAGPGIGGWGSAATFEHELYVLRHDLERARRIMEDDAGVEDFAE